MTSKKKAPKPMASFGVWCIMNIQLQKEVISIQKQPNCEKSVRPLNSRVKTNSPELSLLKFLPLIYYHSHFLATNLDFTSIFTLAFWGLTLFSQLRCFCIDRIINSTSTTAVNSNCMNLCLLLIRIF